MTVENLSLALDRDSCSRPWGCAVWAGTWWSKETEDNAGFCWIFCSSVHADLMFSILPPIASGFVCSHVDRYCTLFPLSFCIPPAAPRSLHTLRLAVVRWLEKTANNNYSRLSVWNKNAPRNVYVDDVFYYLEFAADGDQRYFLSWNNDNAQDDDHFQFRNKILFSYVCRGSDFAGIVR